MKYKDKLLELIFSDDEEAFKNWAITFPELEQIEIFREFAQVIQELSDESGNHFLDDMMIEFKQKVDDCEEKCLDVDLADLKYEMAVDNANKAAAQLDEKLITARSYIKECIESNAPNAEEMKQMAREIIAIEKEVNFYDPANWLWFDQETLL